LIIVIVVVFSGVDLNEEETKLV